VLPATRHKWTCPA